MSAPETKELTRVWEARSGETAPIEDWCEVFGWPKFTISGKLQYENTHFLDKAKAWECLRVNAQAGIDMGASEVVRLKKLLQQAKKNLVEVAS